MERQEWLLARELLCHRCRAKLFWHPSAGCCSDSCCTFKSHTQGKAKSMQSWCASTSDLSHAVASGCSLLLPQYKTYFGRTLKEFRILLLEITSGDVTGHPRLLAAKQPEGFPFMVKAQVAPARRGVSAGRLAS